MWGVGGWAGGGSERGDSAAMTHAVGYIDRATFSRGVEVGLGMGTGVT